jgi:hypothetical protein
VTTRERFRRVLQFKPVDRLPVIEWAGWWDKTIERWHAEGLPAELQDAAEIRQYFGQDRHCQMWVSPRAATCPTAPSHGAGIVRDRADYLAVKPHLYPDQAFDERTVEQWAQQQRAGEMVVWLSLDGFFWFPRTLLGIQGHLLAFYDQPDLMREMNEDLLVFNLRVFEQFCDICVPDFMTFGEDMSYNHGPMLSKDMFDEFLAPYYRLITPALRERGTVVFVDTDGDVTVPIAWYEQVGVQGFLPLERMAGVDVAALREKHPRMRLLGAFDKTVMHRGEARMREEFERLLPVMRQGGFIPSCDHQTPPEVSLEDYRLYMRLLREYCEKAADERQQGCGCGIGGPPDNERGGPP